MACVVRLVRLVPIAERVLARKGEVWVGARIAWIKPAQLSFLPVVLVIAVGLPTTT